MKANQDGLWNTFIITKFCSVMKSPRKPVLATVLSMRQSHSTHCSSCDIILLPWGVAQQLGDVKQQFWDSYKTHWDVAEALRLSHCLVARALWLLHSWATDWELETQKKGSMCKPTTQNIIHNPGYVRSRTVLILWWWKRVPSGSTGTGALGSKIMSSFE